MITLYDIPGPLPGQSWSPNTMKARFALNFKSIPYETKWVEYPDIEALYKTLGAKTLDTHADGSPYYTLPLIVDASQATGKDPVIISDSWTIAAYLDEAYPDTPKLFPKGTKALQAAFQDAWTGALLTHGPPILFIRTTDVALNPASAEFFHRSRKALSGGKTLKEIEPHGEARVKHFKDWEANLGKIAKVYEKVEGEYLMGDQVVYADFVAAAWVRWVRLVAKKEDWETISGWHGGLLGKIGERVEQYVKLP